VDWVESMDTRKKLHSIQVIRALSAIMIVGHHVALYMNDSSLTIVNNLFINGWVGVDVFFVLSGFLLYYTSYKKIAQKGQCKDFLFKRLSRIYPVYWIVLSAVLIIWPSYFGAWYLYSIMDILNSFMLMPQEALPVLGVTWFLSFTVFSYFIFAILIFFKKKTSYTIVTAWVLGVLLNSFELLPTTNIYVDFIFSNHYIEIIAGYLIAFMFMKNPVKKPILSLLSGCILFLIIFYQIIDGALVRNSTASMFLFSLAVGLIILGCVSYEFNRDISFPKSVLAVGDASYAIYLTHFNLLTFTDLFNQKLGLHSITAFLYHTILLILLGILFYYFVEKRVINNMNLISRYKKSTKIVASVEKRAAS